jgi:hypothetical protein
MPLEVRNTLNDMCKESKRHCKCNPPTSGTFINCVFSFLKVLDFFYGEAFHCS